MSKTLNNIKEEQFLKSIVSGDLDQAASYLLENKLEFDSYLSLLLLRLDITILKRAQIEGRLPNIDEEMRLKNKIASQLICLYDSIYPNTLN